MTRKRFPKANRATSRETRTHTALRGDTSSTAGGPQRSVGTIESPLSNDSDEFEPVAPKFQEHDWAHAAKTAGIVLGGLLVAGTVVITAITMSKDLEVIGGDVDRVNAKVDALTNRATVIETKIDGMQSSVNEVRRDVRDDQMSRAKYEAPVRPEVVK